MAIKMRPLVWLCLLLSILLLISACTQRTSRYRGNPITGRASDVESGTPIASSPLLGTCKPGTFMVGLTANGPVCKTPQFYGTMCKDGKYLNGIEFNGTIMCRDLPESSPPSAPGCIDSDNGPNPMRRGQAQDGSMVYQDRCDLDKDSSGKTVLEFSCKEGKMISEHMNCETISPSFPYCRFGACSTAPITCTDPDGLNEFTKGETATDGIDQEVNQGRETSTDSCGEGNVNMGEPFTFVQTCNDPSCFVREGFCESSDVVAHLKDIPCENGCKDGACIKTPSLLYTQYAQGGCVQGGWFGQNKPAFQRPIRCPWHVLQSQAPGAALSCQGSALICVGFSCPQILCDARGIPR